GSQFAARQWLGGEQDREKVLQLEIKWEEISSCPLPTEAAVADLQIADSKILTLEAI
ncbi:hypothetical protein A2U01_0094369, partial [Trifolium medium]|nr:hypothetical protein [Trifolium medium]